MLEVLEFNFYFYLNLNVCICVIVCVCVCVIECEEEELASEVGSERRESGSSEGASVVFENVDEFEIKRGKEENFGRSGMEVGMNECEFRICISLEIEEFIGEE